MLHMISLGMILIKHMIFEDCHDDHAWCESLYYDMVCLLAYAHDSLYLHPPDDLHCVKEFIHFHLMASGLIRCCLWQWLPGHLCLALGMRF